MWFFVTHFTITLLGDTGYVKMYVMDMATFAANLRILQLK